MSVAWRDGTIVLEGACGVEDAEALLRSLLDHPGSPIDWRGCTVAHTAVIQVLLATRILPLGPPNSAILRDLVEPALRRDNPSAH